MTSTGIRDKIQRLESSNQEKRGKVEVEQLFATLEVAYQTARIAEAVEKIRSNPYR